MYKKKVVIVGSSGHAKVIIDIFEKMDEYEIVGLIDDGRPVGAETLGYKIIGDESILKKTFTQDGNCELFIAIGDNFIRYKVWQKIIALFPNAVFARAIHPQAIIGKNVIIDRGVAIMAGTVVNSNSKIGDFAIVNTNASVDHDCRLARFSSLGPNSCTGGNVSIGEFSAVSIGATVTHNVSIGNHSIIGASSLVNKDCGENSVYYGIPSTFIRSREIGEKYL